MKKIFLGLVCIINLHLISCRISPLEPPSLVVLIVVDQMRPDLLTRYDELYTGGFRWLMDNGIWFKDTHHEHGYTATGPGHAAIGFGQYPGKVGVIGNSFYDRILKKKVNCVEDPNAIVVGSNKGKARSSSRYDTQGLGDWIKLKNSNSKVLSIGGKDRAACFLGGKNPDQAIYYNKAGAFISSNYYVNELPQWATKFNQKFKTKKYGDSLWQKSLHDDLYLQYAREDYFYGEEDNYLNDEYSPIFPIGINIGENPLSVLMGTPWFEREILELSKDAIISESLGLDNAPDLLAIGFSAMDWIIHSYGPYSQETMDACIKLDQYLGKFIEFLDVQVGLDNIFFTLTADHGGLPLPEYLIGQGEKGGRINKKHMQEALRWIDDECQEIYGNKLYHRDGANFFLDWDMMKKKDINSNNIYNIIDKYLTKVEGIDRIVLKDNILGSEDTSIFVRRLKHMIHEEKSPEIFPIVSKGYIYRESLGTSHGTPYDYDTHVPLIFARQGFKMSERFNRLATVDIAPTIAQYLDIQIPDYCDGKMVDL